MKRNEWRNFRFGSLGVFLLVVLLVGVWVQPAAAAKEWPRNLTLTTTPAGSTLSVYGIGVAKIIESALKISTSPELCGGSLPAMMLFVKGDGELAVVNSVEMVSAYYEEAPFRKGASAVTRGVLFGEYAAIGHWVTRADSNIKSIPDLKGKRVMCRRPNQALYECNWKATLEAYGLSEKNVTIMPALGHGDATAALKEKRVDAFFHFSAIPGPAFVELDNSTPIRILPLSEEALKHVSEKCLGVSASTIPAGTYKTQTQAVRATKTDSGLLARADLPDDLVYAIAKAMHENLDQFKAIHPSFKNWTIKGLVNGASTPYHAGAYKYFMEQGLLTEESIAKHKAMLGKTGQTR